MAKKTVAAKKRNVKVDANGQLHVHSSFNNIIVSLANSEGQIISWSSAGKMGFRGSKKNTPYAAQMAAQDCAKVAFDLGLRKVKAYVKGPGNGRESAIRTETCYCPTLTCCSPRTPRGFWSSSTIRLWNV